jgi:type IV secretory pathway protease TraF
LQEEAIRTHNSDALVVGAPPQDTAQDSEEEGALQSSCSLLQQVTQLLPAHWKYLPCPDG